MFPAAEGGAPLNIAWTHWNQTYEKKFDVSISIALCRASRLGVDLRRADERSSGGLSEGGAPRDATVRMGCLCEGAGDGL